MGELTPEQRAWAKENMRAEWLRSCGWMPHHEQGRWWRDNKPDYLHAITVEEASARQMLTLSASVCHVLENAPPELRAMVAAKLFGVVLDELSDILKNPAYIAEFGAACSAPVVKTTLAALKPMVRAWLKDDVDG